MTHWFRNLVSLVPAFVLLSALAQAQATYRFDLPEQPLADSLRAIAAKTGTNILFDSRDVKNIKAASLHDELAINDAIERVLAGTRLGTESTTPTTVIVRPIDDDDNEAPAEDLLLEEVIVSARRRDEQWTQVPASITAYSSDFLQKQNIRSFVDYATRIPNLTFQYGQGADLLWSGGRETTIRGVAGSGTTAYYINDTPVPSSVSPTTLDLDRIEVLKGPQGTLFGASSMGGNLRFITNKPSLTDDTGTLQIQSGRTKSAGVDFDGSVRGNFVLVPEQIGLGAALGYVRESGFITRRFPGGSKDGQGRNDTFAGSATFRAKVSDSLEATVNALGQATHLHGFPGAYVPLPGYEPLSYTVDRDRDVEEYSKDRWALGSFVLNYAGEGLAVASSTSYFSRRIEEREDDTEGTDVFFEEDLGIDLDDGVFLSVSLHKETRITQETRLFFDEGTLSPRVAGIAGIFYQRSLVDAEVPFIPVQEMQEAGLYPTNLAASAVTSHSDNAAIFGELYYEVVPNLTLTLGLRQYWIEQKTDASTETGFIFGPEGEFNPALRNSQSGLVPKAVLSYEMGDHGNLYASASKGFRAGGSQPRLPDICTDDLANLGVTRDDVREYRSDRLWSYEIGAKSRLVEGRLSASVAAFQLDWSDIQQTLWLPACALSFFANAGEARIRGGELEITGRPFAEVPLSVQVGLGHADGVLLDPGLLPQAPRSSLGQIPRWTGSIAGYYATPISERISGFLAVDYSHTSAVRVADGLGGFLNRQPFNLVNANIGIRFGQSQLLLYGKNLLDERLNFGDQPSLGFERQELRDDGSYQRLPRAVVSRPRQLGLQYRMDF
jgi:iron complex outermembrane recepter protein